MYSVNSQVRQKFASAAFLTAIIGYSAALLFSLLSSFMYRSSAMSALSSLAGLAKYNSSVNSILRGFNTGSSIATLLGMLPQIFLTVCFWLIYAGAVNRNSNGSLLRTGLKMVNIYLLIMFFLLCAVAVLSALGLLLSAVGAISLLDNYRGAAEYGGGVVVVLLVGLAVGGGVFTLAILFMLKARKNVLNIMVDADNGSGGPMSRFVTVLCFIIGGFNALDALISITGSPISGLTSAASATAAITFGIFLTKYKSSASGSRYTNPVWDSPVQNGRNYFDPPTAAVPAPPASRSALLYRTCNGDNIPINSAQFVVGRSSMCDYAIRDNPGISSVHATFLVKDGNYYVVDNNSTNHVYVNGLKMQLGTKMKLHDRDIIKLYNEQFVFILN